MQEFVTRIDRAEEIDGSFLYPLISPTAGRSRTRRAEQSRRGEEINGVSIRRIPTGLPGAGIPIIRLHVSADPNFGPDKQAALRSKYTSEARYRREIEIEYEALEGELLYPEFNR